MWLQICNVLKFLVSLRILSTTGILHALALPRRSSWTWTSLADRVVLRCVIADLKVSIWLPAVPSNTGIVLGSFPFFQTPVIVSVLQPVLLLHDQQSATHGIWNQLHRIKFEMWHHVVWIKIITTITVSPLSSHGWLRWPFRSWYCVSSSAVWIMSREGRTFCRVLRAQT